MKKATAKKPSTAKMDRTQLCNIAYNAMALRTDSTFGTWLPDGLIDKLEKDWDISRDDLSKLYYLYEDEVEPSEDTLSTDDLRDFAFSMLDQLNGEWLSHHSLMDEMLMDLEQWDEYLVWKSMRVLKDA